MPAPRTDFLRPMISDMMIPTEGLDLSKGPRLISPLSGSASNALRMRDNVLVPSYGRSKVGSTLLGSVQAVTHFQKFTGAAIALVITTKGIYKWVTNDWVLVQETYTAGTVTLAASATVEGSGTKWTEYIHAGDIFHADQDPGATTYIVDSVTDDDTLVLTEAYAGATGAGKDYDISLYLQGDVEYPVTYCTAEDALYFTNQVDWVKKYTGGNLTTLLGGDSYQTPTQHRCRAIRYFGTSLILFSTIEDGVDVYQRVRWSDVGDVTGWTANNFADLVDTPGRVLNGLNLGNVLAIYKRDSIIYMQYVGGSFGFLFTGEHAGVGLTAINSLIAVGDVHFFLGESVGTGYNVFLNVGQQIIPIGAPIVADLRTYVTRKNIWRSWAVWNPLIEEVLLFTPISGDDNPSVAWIYEIEKGSLTKGRWWMDSISASAGGLALGGSSFTYGDLVGTYADQDWKYGDARLGEDQELAHLGTIAGDVLRVDLTSVTDEDGAALRQQFTTKAFCHLDIGEPPGTQVRCLGIEFVAKGHSLVVQWSVDEGRTWASAERLFLTGTMARYRCDFDVVGESVTIRFKNRTESGKFRIEQWAIRLQPGGFGLA